MADENDTLILVAGGIAVYLAATGKLSNLFGGAKKDRPGSAAGTPPRPNTAARSPDVVGAVGAGTCVAGGIALGMPALGIGLSPVCSKVAHYVEDAASWAYRGLGGGSSKVGRASNGKDVFPNDLSECQKRGITTVDACGALWDGVKWPWQTFPHQGDAAVFPPAPSPVIFKPAGFR